MADEWAIQVVVNTDGGETSTQIWYAHLSDWYDAKQAVKRKTAIKSHVKIDAVKIILL